MRRDDDSIWPILLGAIVVAGGLAAAYYFWDGAGDTALEPVAPPAANHLPGRAGAGPAAIEHPIAEARVAEEPAADAATGSTAAPPESPPPATETNFVEALQRAAGSASLPDYLVLDKLVEHLVVTVDNLPNDKLPRHMVPVRPPPSAFAGGAAGAEADSAVLDHDDFARYAPYIDWLQTLDMQALATAYVRHYDAFQEAYAALGYPDAYFNDRLVAVIDHLLATPDVPAPIPLVRPGVRYQFADAEIEALSSGKKALIRMGNDNAAVVKARLRELRGLVTAPARTDE